MEKYLQINIMKVSNEEFICTIDKNVQVKNHLIRSNKSAIKNAKCN